MCCVLGVGSGRGVETDQSEAVTLYRRAAEAGGPAELTGMAQFNLGLAYG